MFKNLISTDHYKDLSIQHQSFIALRECLPTKIRRVCDKLLGLKTDQLSEIVTAVAMGTYVQGKRCEGMDFGDGSEGKFATITTTKQVDTKNNRKYTYWKRKAKISNLSNKTGPLHIIVSDPIMKNEIECERAILRFFTIPYKVWRTAVPGNSFSMDFTKDTHKWYMDYELTKKEFFA